MQKIDIHCHTTNRILKNSANPDASLSAITAHMTAHTISHTVLLATYFPQKGSGISNYRLHHWLAGQPHFIMFGSLDMEHYFYQGFNELEEMAEKGFIKGIKLYTAYQHIDFEADNFNKVANLAAKYNMPLMFHGGISYMLWQQLTIQQILALETDSLAQTLHHAQDPYKTPADFERVANTFPDVNLIVSHLCKPFFTDMITALKRTPNLFTDMSGILDSKRDVTYRDTCVETVRRFLGECGPYKLLFGTDFPVQTHADSIHFIEAAMGDYSEADKQRVYRDNAVGLVDI